MGGEAGTVLLGTVRAHEPTDHLTCIDIDGAPLWVRGTNLPIGGSVRVHIHANDVSLATSKPRDCSIQNVLEGTIEAISDDVHPSGALIAVVYRSHRVLARITRRSIASLGLTVGMTVWAQVKSVALSERFSSQHPSTETHQ